MTPVRFATSRLCRGIFTPNLSNWYVSTTLAQLGLEYRVENARFIDWNQRLLQDSQVLVRVKGEERSVP